jgi:hypothetical protein
MNAAWLGLVLIASSIAKPNADAVTAFPEYNIEQSCAGAPNKAACIKL